MGALREPKLLKLEVRTLKIWFCILKVQLPHYQIYAIIASGNRYSIKTD